MTTYILSYIWELHQLKKVYLHTQQEENLISKSLSTKIVRKTTKRSQTNNIQQPNFDVSTNNYIDLHLDLQHEYTQFFHTYHFRFKIVNTHQQQISLGKNEIILNGNNPSTLIMPYGIVNSYKD